MSIVVSIEPIETQTKNGTQALVTGIDLTSGDTFRGRLEYEPGKWRTARWRSNGMMRDAMPSWNLNLSSPERDGLYEAAKVLGAQLN